MCTSIEEVEIASCSGTCESSATFSLEPPYYKQDCSCCKPIKFDPVDVKMFCLRKHSTLKVMRIKECSCAPCGSQQEGEISTEHPTEITEQTPINSDEISNDEVKSGGRRKRSLGEYIYSMFSGE